MKRFILSSLLLAAGILTVHAQEGQIKFQEYDLPNGLHVILHQDHSTPIVNVSVMYHVGSKNEDPNRTGFAHFFEHLMFEGSEYIKREGYMKLVQENGGVLNANTTQDRTYYFEELPSNQLELALWMESERMLHLKIDSVGIETQRKVVKEEKKQRYDNTPYGQIMNVVFNNLFTKHPYRWTPIGKAQYIDQAKYSEFMDFYKTFYVPNNAVLVIAGDFKVDEAKKWVSKYFAGIPKGTKPIPRPTIVEPQQKEEKRVTFHDNVQLPAVILAYHAPKMGSPDFYALDMLTKILSSGPSSRFHKEIVDNQQKALQVGAFAYPLEDPGVVFMFGITNNGVTPKDLEKAMKAEIAKVKSGDITEDEFKKVQNQTEFEFVARNSRISGIADLLATDYTFFRNTNLINTELEKYQNITLADLKRVANKYITPDNSLVVYYLPNEK
jgi:predicted Zn-dependent peptidase